MRLLLFLLAIAVVSCIPVSKDQPLKAVRGTDNYMPPKFIDPDRVAKIKSAAPIVDAIYQNYASQNNFPSITYGVIVDGKLVHSGASGESNLETKQKSNIKTLYRIASMTKSFTAMAILKLRDEGKLSLQDPAAKFVSALDDITYLTSDAHRVTIQDLLTMSAGFPEDNPWGDRQLADTDQELIDLISKDLSFSNAPGLEYEYSNLGFAILGNIIKSISGQSYQQYITENILKPLEMNDSKWEYTEIPEDRLALGYHWLNGEWVEEPILHDGSFGAMGGLICSIEDFSKYVAFHLNAWPPRNDPETGPVNRSTVREMHQLWRINPSSPTTDEYGPLVIGYAYGLNWRKDARGMVRVAHSGGLPGYGSEWRIYPEYGIGVVSFSNRRYGAPSNANAKVIDTLVNLANLKPRELPVSDILKKKKEALVANLPDWKEKPELFAENFYMDKALDIRTNEVKEIFTQAGAILEVGEITPENQLRGTFVIRCEKKSIEIFFTLTPEKDPMIQQLTMTLID